MISDEKEMKILLTFLVYQMKTLDGKKNSAVRLLNYKFKVEENQKFKQEIENDVFSKVIKKFQIMIIRHKISYEAFFQKKTISELIIGQIVKTFHLMVSEQTIKYSLDQKIKDKVVMATVFSYANGSM